MGKKAFLGRSDADYQRVGAEKLPAVWEDGIRSSGKENTFEWWYTDAEFSNGMKIITIFYTKKAFDFEGPANPTVTFEIAYPDGQKYEAIFSEGENALIHASKEKCDVQIGSASIQYIDGDYRIHFENNEVVYTCTMKPKVPMWRPGTGYNYFGEDHKLYFAWLVAQPSTYATASLRHKDKTYELEGNGYHDHNWGNVAMQKVFNHWYWCRACIGPYTVISSDLIAEKKYDYNRIVHFMLSRDGAIITDDETKVTVKREDTVYHPVTGKFIDNHLIFQYVDGDSKYTLEYVRNHDIEARNLLDFIGLTPIQRSIAKLMRMNPTYVRVIGKVKLTVEANGQTETYEQEGLWEQMFFGNNKDATINC